MKTYVFLICRPDGTANFAQLDAASSAEAVREIVRLYPNCRYNISNVIPQHATTFEKRVARESGDDAAAMMEDVFAENPEAAF